MQGARKEAGLAVDDRIVLSIRTESEQVRQAVARFIEMIDAETLTVEHRPLDVTHAEVVCVDQSVGLAVAKA